MKKVVKFGGSSLASAAQFEKVGAIIREDESRRYVVPSAPGKRFSEDTKVTDLLYACYRSVGDEERFHKILDEIKKTLSWWKKILKNRSERNMLPPEENI